MTRVISTGEASAEVMATILALTAYIDRQVEDPMSFRQTLWICANYVNPEYLLANTLKELGIPEFVNGPASFVKKENGEWQLAPLTIQALKYVEEHPGTSETLDDLLDFLRNKIL